MNGVIETMFWATGWVFGATDGGDVWFDSFEF